MGKRTHGPYLIAAIEYGDIDKVSHILSTKFRDKSKVKVFLASEVRRLASEHVEVPLLLAATLADPTVIKYFVTKHEANINFVYEYGPQVGQSLHTCTISFASGTSIVGVVGVPQPQKLKLGVRHPNILMYLLICNCFINCTTGVLSHFIVYRNSRHWRSSCF